MGVFEDILKQTRLLWLNTPHNPSGAVTPLADLHRIADSCREYDILCISDECYADIYSDEPPHSTSIVVSTIYLSFIHCLSVPE